MLAILAVSTPVVNLPVSGRLLSSVPPRAAPIVAANRSPPPPPRPPSDPLSAAAASAAGGVTDAAVRAFISRAEDDFKRAGRVFAPVAAAFAPGTKAATRAGAARDFILAAAVSAAAIEAAQFCAVFLLSWWLGFGAPVGRAPRPYIPGSKRLNAAILCALASRSLTRPLRLLAELSLVSPALRQLRRRRPKARAVFAAGQLVATSAASAALLFAVATADRLVAPPAVASAVPVAVFCRAVYARTVGALGGWVGVTIPSPAAVQAAVKALCVSACDVGRWWAGIAASLGEAARQVKPLRALLDLAETDAWLADALSRLFWQR